MQPEVNQLLPTREVFRVGLQKALEHVGEVSHIELVVEVCRRFAEVVANLVRMMFINSARFFFISLSKRDAYVNEQS